MKVIIPAVSDMNSTRDTNVLPTSPLTIATTIPMATAATDIQTTAETVTIATTTDMVTTVNSPKYSSPPVGSGGKYMVKSKRASWIDGNSLSMSSSSSSSSSSLPSLPDRLMAKQRKLSIPDIGQQTPDTTDMRKSGSLAKLRGHRLPSVDQTCSSPSSSCSLPSSSWTNDIRPYSVPKYKNLHNITPSSSSPASPRNRTSSVSSIITDTSFPLENYYGSPCSSSSYSSYHPPSVVSPMYIGQEKGKPAFVYEPGPSSPLSCEIANGRNCGSKRRSSMSLLKNIPSTELANIINGYSAPLPGDTIRQPPPPPLLNDHTLFTQPMTNSASPTASSSSPSGKSNMGGVPAYQHSLHSFLKRQLSTPAKRTGSPSKDNQDKDIDEIDLNNEHRTDLLLASTSPPVDTDDHLLPVYPAMFLSDCKHDTDPLLSSPSSSRRPSLYLNSISSHTSAPELCGFCDTLDYFDIPIEMERDIGTPPSVPVDFLLSDNADQLVYLSRLQKIKKWCIFRTNASNQTMDVFVRQGLHTERLARLLVQLPLPKNTIHNNADLVYSLPWVNWMDEYDYSYSKLTDKSTNICAEKSSVSHQSLLTMKAQHNSIPHNQSMSTSKDADEVDLHHPLEAPSTNAAVKSRTTTKSSSTKTTMSLKDDGCTTFAHRFPSATSCNSISSTSRRPSVEGLGTIGYCFQNAGNRMGAFGRLGTIVSNGNVQSEFGALDAQSSSHDTSSLRVRHTIGSRLQSAKNACNDELRAILDGLNEYVERGLQYVEDLEDDVEQDLQSDESDDHNDECNITNSNKDNNSKYDNDYDCNDDDDLNTFHTKAQSTSYRQLCPLTMSHQLPINQVPPSVLETRNSPSNEVPLLSLPLSSGNSTHCNTNSTVATRHRSLGIRLKNIEEQVELSSPETDQSQVTTPSDERSFAKQPMKYSLNQQQIVHLPTVSPLAASSHHHHHYHHHPSADLLSKSPQATSRYTMISEDGYSPTPFLLALQDLIGLAQTVLDTHLETYLNNVGECATTVSEIQSVGSRWDKHVEWPCREWYVRLLLCVAALNRVIEWWEAERKFWYSNSTAAATATVSSSNPAHPTMSASSSSSLSSSSSASSSVSPNSGYPPTSLPDLIQSDSPLVECRPENNTQSMDMDCAEETDSPLDTRHRSISETESARSCMESQDNATPSEMDHSAFTDTNMPDYPNNNNFTTKIRHHLLSLDSNKANGSLQLQEAVKRGQGNTVVMELTLEKKAVQYLSPVWHELMGVDPQTVIGKNISDLLAPDDQQVFLTATTALLQDVMSTVEVQFRVQLDGTIKMEMEGKGMMMYNRVTGEASHTMWVIKPLSRHHTATDLKTACINRLSVCSSASSQETIVLAGSANNHREATQQLLQCSTQADIIDDDHHDDNCITCVPIIKECEDVADALSHRLRSLSEPATATTENFSVLPTSSIANDSNCVHTAASDEYTLSTILSSSRSQLSTATVMRRSISQGGIPASDSTLLSTAALMSLPPVLCRVCERLVVASFFEQHSELCVEMHRTEMDVIICNDSLHELKHLVIGFLNQLQSKSQHSGNDGQRITDDTRERDWPSSLENAQSNINKDKDHTDGFDVLPTDDALNEREEERLNNIDVCKELLELLDAALSIPVPESQDSDNEDHEESNQINTDNDGDNVHDLDSFRLTTSVKANMIRILYWRSPPTDNSFLLSLIHDIENVTKGKVNSVNRMRDRLEYNERLRLDFQRHMQQEKGWTEFVDDQENENQQDSRSALAVTSTYSLPAAAATLAMQSLSTLDKDSNNTVEWSEQEQFVSSEQANVPDTAHGSQPKPTLIGRLKNWKPKRAPGKSRLNRRRKRKTHSLVVQPHIMEMETIDTPLASPGIFPKYHHSNLNNICNHKHEFTPSTSETHTSQNITKSEISTQQKEIQKQKEQRHQRQSSTSTLTASVTGTSHRPTPPTIKDYDIIKPISKGAFGSVFLAKKRLTGDYYAIKFLKKSDMIAKNQVTNVKAERMILMTQTDSPFVTKLYYTFQSKDYLYLVLEYLNGGDCSALVKVLGRLPEEWARNYLAEVTLGLAYLYKRNIVHRDLKPDNLLIDQNGHLKLTDFGLSRIGFLDRRVRDELSYGPLSGTNTVPTSPAPSRSNTPPACSPSLSSPSALSPALSNLYKHSYFSVLFDRDKQNQHQYGSHTGSSTFGDSISELGEHSFGRQQQQQIANIYATSARSTPSWIDERTSFNWQKTDNDVKHTNQPTAGVSTSKQQARRDFQAIGTPDYIAPESILGTGEDTMVDWWALGVICYEFLYGYPPFNDESPDKVFENILSRRIDWHENELKVSVEARDFMEKLMTLDPAKRLGANGPEEVKQHPFFKGINWDSLLKESPSFIPQPASEEDTAYFDARGATMQEDESLTDDKSLLGDNTRAQASKQIKSIIMEQTPSSLTPLFGQDMDCLAAQRSLGKEEEGVDFGTFVYKNLLLLEKANEDVIRKIRHDSIVVSATSPPSPSTTANTGESTSLSSNKPGAMPASVSNWFHRSLPAISRKKRNSIFDLVTGSGSNGIYRLSSSALSCPSTSLPHMPLATSLPTTPSNLSPSTSSKISLNIPSPQSMIPIAPLPNKKSGKMTAPSKEKSSEIINNISSSRHRSISSPGHHLSHIANTQTVSSSAENPPDEQYDNRTVSNVQTTMPDRKPGGDEIKIGQNYYDQANSSQQEQDKQSLLRSVLDHTSTSLTSGPSPVDRPTIKSRRKLDCLLADDNPISCKILETILTRLHCRCVIVRNGAQAIRYAMGDVQFDLIFMDLRMPIIDGEAAARMIKSSKNHNQNTPIIAVTAYERTLQLIDIFDDSISKPVTREMIEQRLRFYCGRLTDDAMSSTTISSFIRPSDKVTSSPSTTAIAALPSPIPIPPAS